VSDSELASSADAELFDSDSDLENLAPSISFDSNADADAEDPPTYEDSVEPSAVERFLVPRPREEWRTMLLPREESEVGGEEKGLYDTEGGVELERRARKARMVRRRRLWLGRTVMRMWTVLWEKRRAGRMRKALRRGGSNRKRAE